MSSPHRDAIRFLSLSMAQRSLLIEAIGWLLLLRIVTLALPYRRVAALLRLTPSGAPGGPPGGPSGGPSAGSLDGPPPPGGAGRDASGAVAAEWALRAAAARTPWLSPCLVQSLAGYAMMRRRRVPSVVYLGVAKAAEGGLIAHSWLRCGDHIVTGGANHGRYSVIACYRQAAGRRR